MEEAVKSGRALALFLKNVEKQGGNAENLLSEIQKRRGTHKTIFCAQESGFLSLDAFKIGLAGVYLGVGRNRAEDDVCADAGFIFRKIEGEKVQKGEEIIECYGKNEVCLTDAVKMLSEAVSYKSEQGEQKSLIIKSIS